MYVPVLLSAAIVIDLELIWVCCRWRVDLILFLCDCWRNHGVYGVHIFVFFIFLYEEETNPVGLWPVVDGVPHFWATFDDKIISLCDIPLWYKNRERNKFSQPKLNFAVISCILCSILRLELKDIFKNYKNIW